MPRPPTPALGGCSLRGVARVSLPPPAAAASAAGRPLASLGPGPRAGPGGRAALCSGPRRLRPPDGPQGALWGQVAAAGVFAAAAAPRGALPPAFGPCLGQGPNCHRSPRRLRRRGPTGRHGALRAPPGGCRPPDPPPGPCGPRGGLRPPPGASPPGPPRAAFGRPEPSVPNPPRGRRTTTASPLRRRVKGSEPTACRYFGVAARWRCCYLVVHKFPNGILATECST